MAEIATIILGMGGMYLLSNMNDKKEKENMITREKQMTSNLKDIKNYTSNKELYERNEYKDANQHTDKYFDPNYNQKHENIKEKSISSLSGTNIDKKDFVHNNMVPFFGSKVKGNHPKSKNSDIMLDNLQGMGSLQKSKEEKAPLFKPQSSMQYAHGAPNRSDFYQSRMNTSMKMSNVKPWQEEHVGPGLGLGYTTQGSGGFNSGMEARNKWVPKTVDELRTVNNPKQSFELKCHEGPAQSKIQNLGIMGKMEKKLPDTYYVNSPDKWMTTTGLEKKPTVRSENILHDVNRTSTTKEYFGVGKYEDANANYVKGVYEKSKRQTLDGPEFLPANANGQNRAEKNDFGVESYLSIPNNRESTNKEHFGVMGGIMTAVVAPLMDIFRPTRKNNVIGNGRPNGNAKTAVNAMRVFNRKNKLPTTNRQMTESKLDMNHLNVQGQSDGAYQISKQQAVSTERDTTNISYMGNANGQMGQTQYMSYEAAYNQRNNVNKSYKNRPNQGGTQIFNPSVNVQITKKENDRKNNRAFVHHSGPNITPGVESMGQTTIDAMRYQNNNNKRMDSELLSAFKANPYTQSLNSWA